MNKEIVIEKVNKVLIEDFEISPELIRPEATFIDDLKLDSLDAVDMIVSFENELNIKVSGERFQNISTLGDIYQMVYEIINETK